METLEIINQRLRDRFGRFGTSNLPYFRVVWSNEQFEKRLITHTREGFELPNPVVEEVPKYKQWANNRYILEHLVAVPAEFQKDLGGEQLSYEPLWTFQDNKGEPLAPSWAACEFIVRTMRENMQTANGRPKYKDPLAGLNTEELIEAERMQIEAVKQDLFGNETSVGDALMQDSAVGYGIRQRNDKL